MIAANPEATTPVGPERLFGYAKLCVGLLAALGFSLGCSELIGICTPVCHYIAAMWDWHLAMIGTFAMTVIVCGSLVSASPCTWWALPASPCS